MKVAASPRSFDSGLSFFAHRLTNKRRFQPLRMTKRGEVRRFAMAGFPRIASLPLEGKVPRRGG